MREASGDWPDDATRRDTSVYIIVVGGGKVGYYLSKTLLSEGHEVLVIEIDPRKVARIEEELGEVVMEGDGCEATTLESAGTSRAEIMVAVTGDDEDNLITCQLAKGKFRVPRAIARINNPANERIFRALGIDVTISSTQLILSQIEQEIPSRALSHLLMMRHADLEIVEAFLKPGMEVVGKPLRSLRLPAGCVIPVLIRDGQSVVPSGDTTLEAGDEVIVVTKTTNEDELRDVLFGRGA